MRVANRTGVRSASILAAVALTFVLLAAFGKANAQSNPLDFVHPRLSLGMSLDAARALIAPSAAIERDSGNTQFFFEVTSHYAPINASVRVKLGFQSDGGQNVLQYVYLKYIEEESKQRFSAYWNAEFRRRYRAPYDEINSSPFTAYLYCLDTSGYASAHVSASGGYFVVHRNDSDAAIKCQTYMAARAQPPQQPSAAAAPGKQAPVGVGSDSSPTQRPKQPERRPSSGAAAVSSRATPLGEKAYQQALSCSAFAAILASPAKTRERYRRTAAALDKLASENARSIGMSAEKHADAAKAIKGKMFGMSETDTVSLYRSCKSAYAFWEQDLSAPEASPLDVVKVNPARSKQVQVVERCAAVATFVRKYGLLTAPAEQKADWDRRVAIVREQLRQASPGDGAHQAELDAEIASVVDGYLSLDIVDGKNKVETGKRLWMVHAKECIGNGYLQKANPP